VPWFHSIDVGGGVVTLGHKSAEVLAEEFERLGLPDLDGLSVLDIGAWDGFFSFTCEERGAARVVALDHYAWSLDAAGLAAYTAECAAEGVSPQPHETVASVWKPDTLPGRRPFEMAHRLRTSKVEPVVGDFMTMDLAALGKFDVVLFLGVLYHLREPFEALRRLATVAGGLAVVETACAVVPGMGRHALCKFFESDELNGDPTNWWAPNREGLMAMARAAGFTRVACPHAPPEEGPQTDLHYGRAVLQAWRS
jgi:tRNA (mo5U34)-methyltransferase